MKSMLSYCFMLLLILLAIPNAVAQKDTLELREIEVKETRIKVARGFKSQSLDSALLADHTGQNLAEMLSMRSALFLKSYGQGSLATPGFRGTGAQHTQSYWNGMALNYSSLGLSDLSLFPVALFDEVDLHYGASSLVDGSGGLGGALQLNNAERTGNVFDVSLYGGVGSFGEHEEGIKITFVKSAWSLTSRAFYQQAENNFTFTNYALLDQPEQEQVNASTEQLNLLQEVTFRPHSLHTLHARAWYTDNHRYLPPTMLTASSEELQTDKGIKTQFEWDYKFDKGQSIYRFGWLKDENVYFNEVAGIISVNVTRSLQSQWRGKFQVGDRWLLKPSLSARSDEATSFGFEGIRKQQQFAGLMQADWYLNNRIQTSFLIRQEVLQDSLAPILPSIGINIWLLSNNKDQVQLKLNGARNFHAPSLNDLYWQPGGNDQLLPEEGWMGEVGLLWTQKDARYLMSLEASVFNSLINNWIQWIPGEFGIWGAQNHKQVNNRGVELITTVKRSGIKFWQEAHLTYSYTKSSEVDEASSFFGKQLIYVPFHQLAASVKGNVLPSKQLYLEAVIHYTDNRFITTDNTSFLPDYSLLDVNLSYKSNPKKKHSWAAKFSVRNALDQNYQAIAWRPMPGRNYQLSIQYHFKKQYNEK